MSISTKDDVFQGLARRIREERLRLAMTQEQFGEIGRVKRATQILYEQGATRPSLTYIALVAAAGADLRYLLHGERTVKPSCEIHLHPDVMEKAMALADRISRDDRGRLLDPEIRHAVLKQLLLAVSEKTEDEIDWDDLYERIAV